MNREDIIIIPVSRKELLDNEQTLLQLMPFYTHLCILQITWKENEIIDSINRTDAPIWEIMNKYSKEIKEKKCLSSMMSFDEFKRNLIEKLEDGTLIRPIIESSNKEGQKFKLTNETVFTIQDVTDKIPKQLVHFWRRLLKKIEDERED